jgi:phage repressor protein C with HTH and peptisase S24 domain
MSIKKRLQEYCKEKKTTIGTFCRHARISSSYFNNVKSDIGKEIQKKIANTYDDLNIEWLRTGEGEMLKVPATLTIYNPTAEEGNTMSEGVDMSVVPAEVVEEIRKEVKAEIEQESAITVIPVEVASQVDVDIKKYIEENESELKKLSPSDLTGDVDGLEEVRKNSMWPALVPGDRVFLKFLKHKAHIVDGGIYYFNLKDRPTMIRQVKIIGDKLRLIALNPQFCDIVTSLDNVLRVADVKGMYREFFSDQYSEIEAVRRKKDHQIDLLIEQLGDSMKEIGKAGTRQDKLIEIIEKKL